MKRTLLATFFCLLFIVQMPAVAQEIQQEPAQETELYESPYKAIDEEIKAQYINKRPEDIWQEYISNRSTYVLVADVQTFQAPFFDWGLEEILKRELEPQSCGLFLSDASLYEASIKDIVFKKCMGISYSYNDFDSFVTYPLKEFYMESFVRKILENPDLSNYELFILIRRISNIKLKMEIASRININELNGLTCNIVYGALDLPDYEFFGSICQQINIQNQIEDRKNLILTELMRKSTGK